VVTAPSLAGRHSMSASERRRLAVLFHESEILGAGLSVLRVLPEFRRRGWEASGWFPGPGRLVEQAGDMLAARGHEAKPIAFSGRGWRRPPGPLRRAARTPAYLRAVRTWLRQVEPDLVHANSLLMLPEASVARALGVPVVVQVHELPPDGRKRDATVRWAAAVGDVLVGVSDAVSAMLREHAGLTPVLTVRNGVPPAEPAARPADSFVVGTVGYMSRTKGTDIFLSAAELARAERPGLRFEHVGQQRLWGDDAFDDTIEQRAAAPPLRESLTLLGRAPVRAALARWSVFVLASRSEGFPLSTLEAMAAGLPVIATAVGGVPEQLRHLETGILVAPEEPAEIADWIVRLHDDATLRARLGDAARAHVLGSFTLAVQAEGLDRAYDLAVRRAWARRRRRATTGVTVFE
jgi:glycosyltransferase involved in cell wall biosynthesis